MPHYFIDGIPLIFDSEHDRQLFGQLFLKKNKNTIPMMPGIGKIYFKGYQQIIYYSFF